MTVADVLRWIQYRPTPATVRAMRYLEGRGLRVCVDFGYSNAIALAREDWRTRHSQKQPRFTRGSNGL